MAKGFILADVHESVTNKRFLSAIMDAVADERPDWLVWLGDIQDFPSVSRHVSDFDRPSLSKDYEGIAGLFATVERRSPTTVQWWKEGNHENQVGRFLTARAPSVRDMLLPEKWVAANFPKVRWVPEKKALVMGRLTMVHGHEFMTTMPSKHFAVRLAELYARPGHTAICGHTHKSQYIELPHYFGPRRGIGLGCVRTIDAKWDVQGPASGWVNEFAIVNFRSNGHPDVNVLQWRDGKFRLNEKLYGGKR